MSYERKDNSGALFKNNKREKETHPHARGSALIGGVEYWVSAWTNQSKAGEVYQSLSFQLKDEQPASAAPSNLPEARDPFADEDIPF